MRRLKTHYLFYSLLVLFATQTVFVAEARILNDDEAGSADIASLTTESALFETLQKGIALSLAQCEFDAVCAPNVRRQGLQRIVDVLGVRISSIGVRYEETGEAELEQILISYVDSRDVYSGFIEKLGTIAPELDAEEDAGLEEEDIFANQFGRLPNIRQLYSVFEDVDEEILDDEDLDEFEEVPVDEEPSATEEQIQ